MRPAKTEQHLESISLKGGCPGSSESTMIKEPHCWNSHVTAQMACAGSNGALCTVCVSSNGNHGTSVQQSVRCINAAKMRQLHGKTDTK